MASAKRRWPRRWLSELPQDKFKGGSHYRVALVDLDPMKGLVAWWQRRGRTENPTIFEGGETAADAVERLEMDGWDICIMDSPPAFLTVIDEMIRAADFTVIPTQSHPCSTSWAWATC